MGPEYQAEIPPLRPRPAQIPAGEQLLMGTLVLRPEQVVLPAGGAAADEPPGAAKWKTLSRDNRCLGRPKETVSSRGVKALMRNSDSLLVEPAGLRGWPVHLDVIKDQLAPYWAAATAAPVIHLVFDAIQVMPYMCAQSAAKVQAMRLTLHNWYVLSGPSP